MLIPCPHCGPRESDEFTYIGDAERTPPALDAPEAVWTRYVFARRNPMGRHREYWQHTGCRAVLAVTRNTLTHEVEGCEIVGPHAATAAGAGE
ncbi:sarcosine oxidase subunit delta [Acuticoccus mangrovi]|uniref:Sarcosine oxidase subunit delta n=1 Tax=Acuticoccus mangrovi TaxID=2796142 RepID=A0A934IFR1_9HYPH|nr:sarcosine oxidase subunit delta [Acuticoccus mangrovi]MBJ3775819.1 sarcosine oxidase subunit delta [Acuticoccus mangrovi]